MNAQLADWEVALLSPRPLVSFDVLPERPAEPELGDIWWQPISEVLHYWSSVDGASPGDWEYVLAEKRCDGWYQHIKAEIRENGFTSPLTCSRQAYPCCPHDEHEEIVITFGDGHHRLAACIELGYTHIPIRLSDWENLIAHDSGGYWSRNNEE